MPTPLVLESGVLITPNLSVSTFSSFGYMTADSVVISISIDPRPSRLVK